MKFTKFTKVGKVLTSKEQKVITGGKGCGCNGNNGNNNPPCHEC